MKRSTIVAAALQYAGTPYVHGGRVLGVGVDCIGLVWCAARDAGIAVPELLPYPRSVDLRTLRSLIQAHMQPIPIAEIKPADVITFRFTVEQHFGLITAPREFIHAYAKVERCIVSPLRGLWERNLCNAWRFKVELEDE